MSKSFMSKNFKDKIERTRKAIVGLEAYVPIDAEKTIRALYKEICSVNKDFGTVHRMASRVKNILKSKYEGSLEKKKNKLKALIKEFNILTGFFVYAKYSNEAAIDKMLKKVKEIVEEKDKEHSSWKIGSSTEYKRFSESEYLSKNFFNNIKGCEKVFKGIDMKKKTYINYINHFRGNVCEVLWAKKTTDGKNVFDRVANYLDLLAGETSKHDNIKGYSSNVDATKGDINEIISRFSKVKEMYKWVDERASESEVYKLFLKSRKPKGYESIPGLINQYSRMVKDVYDVVTYGNYKNKDNGGTLRTSITSSRDICIRFMSLVSSMVKLITKGSGFEAFDKSSLLEDQFGFIENLKLKIDDVKKNSEEKKENFLDEELSKVSDGRMNNINEVNDKLNTLIAELGKIKGNIKTYEDSIKNYEMEVKKKRSPIARAKLVLKIIAIVIGISGQLIDLFGKIV